MFAKEFNGENGCRMDFFAQHCARNARLDSSLFIRFGKVPAAHLYKKMNRKNENVRKHEKIKEKLSLEEVGGQCHV